MNFLASICKYFLSRHTSILLVQEGMTEILHAVHVYMCVCVYVCMCMCVCVCVCVYVCMCVCVYVCMDVMKIHNN